MLSALEPFADLSDSNQKAPIEYLRAEAMQRSLLSPRMNDDAQPLDAFLRDFVANVREAMQINPQVDDTASIDAPLAALQREAERIRCNDCSYLARYNGAVCDGGPFDADIVNAGGECQSLVRDSFQVALAVTRAYYGAYSPTDLGPTRASYLVRHKDDLELGSSSIFVTAHVEPGDPKCVTLTVNLEKFTWTSLRAVSYLLMHECLIHLHERERAAVATRPDANDPFGEGWMDWIALTVLEEATRGEGPAARYSDALLMLSSEPQAARDAHAHRLDASRSRDDAFRIKLRRGAEAAEHMLRLLKTLPSGAESAWETLLRVSFDLNREDIETLDRHAWIDKLYLELSPAAQLSRPALNLRLIPALLEYRKSRNIRELLAAVIYA